MSKSRHYEPSHAALAAGSGRGNPVYARLDCFVALLLAMTTLFFSPQLFAFEAFGPINLRTQHPVFLQASDLTPRAAKVLPAHTLQLRQDFAYSNLFEVAENSQTRLDFDMELMRTNFNLLWGMGKGFQLGLEVPFERFDEGFLDGFIDDYHQTFGLPEGGRNLLPNNRFRYQFIRNGTNVLDLPEQSFALSDVIFSLQHQVNQEGRRVPILSWFADFRLPTGMQQDGTTTDEPGMVMGLAMQKSHKRFHGYGNFAYVLTGVNEAMQHFIHDERFAFTLTGEYSILPTWSVLAQFSGGTPFGKNAGLSFWDQPPLDVVVGFRGKEPKLIAKRYHLVWQAAFSEDITSDGPSVDFTVFFSLGVELAL